MASFLQEKVHIVVGKDVQQGSGLIRWAISKWSNQPVTFIILQILIKPKDLINTPSEEGQNSIPTTFLFIFYYTLIYRFS